MTTYVQFAPSTAGPFQFQPVLDGITYNAVVTWNVFGQRYYLNLYDLSGNLVVCTALVGSPAGLALQSLAWASRNGGTATATTLAPHGMRVGSVPTLTIAGAAPAGYNATYARCLVTGPLTFTYPVASDPGGPATVPGSVLRDFNLISGQIGPNGTPFSSTLVFREASATFEGLSTGPITVAPATANLGPATLQTAAAPNPNIVGGGQPGPPAAFVVTP